MTLLRWVWEQRWGLSIVAMLVGAAVLTAIVRDSQLLAGEAPVTRWLHEHDGYGLGWLAKAWGAFIAGRIAPAIWVGAVLLAWRAWGRYAAATVFGAGLLTAPVSLIDLAARPRPTEELVWGPISGAGGYPSGHVTFAVLVFGAFAYLAGRHMATSWRRSAVQWGIWAFIALMGPARVMTLAHWPADVLASYLIAFPQLLFVCWLHPLALPFLRDRLPWAYEALHGERVLQRQRADA